MPSRRSKPPAVTVAWIDQMCMRARLAPCYVGVLRSQRGGCTPKRYRAALPTDDQRVVADVSVLPFHINAYVISMIDPPDGAEAECVLEIVRRVLVRFDGAMNCVSLYRDGPAKLRHIAHIRFHDPPQGPSGIEENVQLIIEIALLQLRGRDVRALLQELQSSTPNLFQ